jgi:dynein heavy chain
MGALIVIDVHAKEVVDHMVKVRVDNIVSFDWTCRLRYYWEEVPEERRSDAFAKQTNTRFRYGYEYLGNGPRLVITPLTDKCYMTLTGALHLNFGGNPQGPAGTGKTETTKDLGKALAIQCVVFNCSDGLDYKMMARFFSGLAQGGAWSCFDEFNRINIEVLSVIAQQMLTIQSAVRAKAPEFEFGGKIIPLNLRFGVFITMNPGYAGRTELPDNLKALFRPVAMMIPDYRLIAQIILYSEGFETAEELARKMVQLYRLASEQLSKQDHYDFGMRAVKSVLVMAGQLRRQDANTPENIVLIRAMRDSNVPKFLEHDLPLFEGIVTDLFPGVDVPFIDYGQLQVAIEHQLTLNCLQCVPKYVKKIIQLLETMMVRHGVMVVGTTGTGKTTCSATLAKALAELHAGGSGEFWHK